MPWHGKHGVPRPRPVRLGLEPLEDRFLLSATLAAPAGGLAAVGQYPAPAVGSLTAPADAGGQGSSPAAGTAGYGPSSDRAALPPGPTYGPPADAGPSAAHEDEASEASEYARAAAD